MDWSQTTFKRNIRSFNSLGVQGGDLGYRRNLWNDKNILCLQVICGIVERKKWNPVSLTWIASYSFRMARIRIKIYSHFYWQLSNCETLFQFLVYLHFLPRLEFLTACVFWNFFLKFVSSICLSLQPNLSSLPKHCIFPVHSSWWLWWWPTIGLSK